ncbi:MAG: DUF1573 domain-containing protein [Atribacterota bacterium]|nr:DUF1573 domain-containing protein [Atribacterota bacterium]MDD5637366.1 DUF1573 domain-containing protein [Atribacterota bacterium]
MSFISRKQIIILFAICVLLINLAGCSKTKQAKLVLSEENWHYGEVMPDQIVSHQFTLKNEGEDKLIIESVYSSCACVSLELSEKEIPAGGETQLKTTFDPYGYEGDVSKYITIKSNDPEHPEKKIDLTITVARLPNPDIKLSQQTFVLGNISGQEQSVLQFTITNTGDADLVIEDIVVEDIFSHNLKLPLTMSPGKHYQAEVYLSTSQLKEGKFRKAIRIMTNDPQNPMVFLRISGIRS